MIASAPCLSSSFYRVGSAIFSLARPMCQSDFQRVGPASGGRVASVTVLPGTGK